MTPGDGLAPAGDDRGRASRLDVRRFSSLPSTMDEAGRLADLGAPAGTVVVADEQTAGRGRRGHSWSSPAGAGLYLTYVARPSRQVGLVTLAAGVGVQRGLASATGLETQLKWPNDVMVGRRKLAGVLAEGVRLGQPEAAVLVGVGINVLTAAHPPDVDARATSLEAELGRAPDRELVLTAVLDGLGHAFASLERGGADGILEDWRALAPSAVGTPVTWQDAGRPRTGITAGIDGTGALLVRTAEGLERIIAGDLEWALRG